MRFNLGSLLSALEGWILCIEECSDECSLCIDPPDEIKTLKDSEKLYVALYLAGRKTMDYRVAAAMHIYFLRNRVLVNPELLMKALSKAKIISRIPPTMEDDSPYLWEAVKWRGVAYAQTILDLEKLLVIKVKPPRSKREREKLRILLEGKRISTKRKTYTVEGMIKKLSGDRIAPWIYVVPKKALPKLLKLIKEESLERIYLYS